MISLVVNEVQLTDSPMQNPFDESPTLELRYFTIGAEKKGQSTEDFTENVVLWQFFRLSEIKTIRNRTVYNVITLISEVSGFADILIVFWMFVMSRFYVSPLMTYDLTRGVAKVDLPIKHRKKGKNDGNIALCLGLNRYKQLRLSLWHVLTGWCLPKLCVRRR